MKAVAKMLIIVVGAMCLLTGPSFANENRTCQPVGGGILTNFLDSTETLGTATGDLAGGLGVVVLGVAAGANGTTVYHVHHHWVTVSGDTILFNDAFLTAFPSGASGLVVADYLNGVTINSGTGRFVGATGALAVFGAVDLNKGLLTLRYQGQVCLQPVAGD